MDNAPSDSCDYFTTNRVVTLIDGRHPALVIAAADVRDGDLLDGWLRVDSVRRCPVDDDLVDLETADVMLRFATQMPCLVQRGDRRAA